MTAKQGLVAGAWGLSAAVLALAFMAWGQGNSWQLGSLSTYQLFPILGLIAFSLMWVHYMVAAARTYLKIDRSVTTQYFEITSFVVLVAIVLHPGLLAWQLWRDGFGLPPGSELDFVGSSLAIWIIVAFSCWALFLTYEFRRVFGGKPWWKFIQYATDVAMVGIYFHALNLGSQLQAGWFQAVWYFYGLTLITALVYIYVHKYQARKQASTQE